MGRADEADKANEARASVPRGRVVLQVLVLLNADHTIETSSWTCIVKCFTVIQSLF